MSPLDKLRDYLHANGLEGVFISGKSFQHYFTGFTGGDSLLYVDQQRQLLITDSRYTLQVKQQAPQCEVIEHKSGFWPVVASLPVGTHLALDGDYFSFVAYQSLAQALPDVSWQSVDLVTLRQVKTAAELQLIKKAVAIADEAFAQLLPKLKAGRTEASLAAELEYNMRRLGSEETAFTTIAASGARSALPHGIATAKVVEKGDLLTFDFGATYQGYRSDITRTIVMGAAAPWQKKIYDIVLKANLLGESVLKPQVSGLAVDGAVRTFITEQGYGPNFGHGLGHGVGLDIHELPVLNTRNREPLPAGAVVTIEPGIYLPGQGGVRIEDTVVITEQGCEKLTATTKKLLEIY